MARSEENRLILQRRELPPPSDEEIFLAEVADLASQLSDVLHEVGE